MLALFLPFCQLPDYVKSLEKMDVKKAPKVSKLFKTPVLWLFIVMVILYAFAEGTFSNWAVVYLNEEKGIPLTAASVALSVFWAMIAIGRLLSSVLLLKISSDKLWLFLPVLMIITFLILPLAETGVIGISLFGLAGLACSAFFPLSVDLVSKQFPQSEAFVSSLMIAALMTGVGVGSFVIGPLRNLFTLDNLYRLSGIYPLIVLGVAFILKLTKLKTANIKK